MKLYRVYYDDGYMKLVEADYNEKAKEIGKAVGKLEDLSVIKVIRSDEELDRIWANNSNTRILTELDLD